MIHIKSTGIVRRLDSLGRVVIPMELRRMKAYENNDPIEIFTEGEFIILRKYEPHCAFCDEMSKIITFKGKHLCPDCIALIKAAGE